MLSDLTRMTEPNGYLVSHTLAANSKQSDSHKAMCLGSPVTAPVREINSCGIMVEKYSTTFLSTNNTAPRPLVEASVTMIQFAGCLKALTVLTNGTSIFT